MQNACAHHYFIKQQNKRKVKGITLRELLKWKQFCIYVPTRNLHTKIMQEEHDMSVVRHHGEKNMTMAIGNGSIGWRCRNIKNTCASNAKQYSPFIERSLDFIDLSPF